MNLLQKIQYSQFWNIGFCEQTPEDLVQKQKLNPIRWLTHPYRDRWFADPFIYRVTDNEIVVFVEECMIEQPKGIICELVIDKQSLHLKERYVMIELDSHLSYPAILRINDRVYVYPENGASGRLNIYEYDKENHRLVNPICILDEAVADATILENGGRYFMCATKFPHTQERAYIYEASHPFDLFHQVRKDPFQLSRSCSRQGGGWLLLNNKTYRPAQDCGKRYGAALNIMEVFINSNEIQERQSFQVGPAGNRYHLGLHTLNFQSGICVVDGCGYFFPFLGRLYYNSFFRPLFKSILRR